MLEIQLLRTKWVSNSFVPVKHNADYKDAFATEQKTMDTGRGPIILIKALKMRRYTFTV